MRLTRNKHSIVMLLVVAFITQSVAAVNLSCTMPSNDSAMAVMSMDNMDHSAHAMHGSSAIDQFAKNCCENDTCPEGRTCTMSGCMWAPSINTAAVVKDSLVCAGLLNLEYTVSYLTPSLLSLYRPPISR